MALYGLRACFGLGRQDFADGTARKLDCFRVPAHQVQNCRDEAETVVRFSDLEMPRNAGIGATREEQDGMGGRSQKRAMIPSRIEIADVEIPMVVGEDLEVGFGKKAAPLGEAS